MDEDFTLSDVLGVLGCLALVGLLIGVIVLSWITVLGPWANDVNNTLFNTSQQHLGAVAQKFSDDCQQLAQTHDPVARKAIENDIYQVASTVDLSKVQMPDVTRTCVNSAINDVTNSH